MAEPVDGLDLGRTARALAEAHAPGLGYARYVAQGGDVGAGVADAMGRRAPEGLIDLPHERARASARRHHADGTNEERSGGTRRSPPSGGPVTVTFVEMAARAGDDRPPAALRRRLRSPPGW